MIDSLLALPDEPTRRIFLETHATKLTEAEANDLANALKAQADHYLRAELATAFQFAHLLLYWGELRHNPFHRALGLRAQANALSIGQGHYREALVAYNEAAAIYRDAGRTLDEAKAQIGKVWPLAGGAIRRGDAVWGVDCGSVGGAWRSGVSWQTISMNIAQLWEARQGHKGIRLH